MNQKKMAEKSLTVQEARAEEDIWGCTARPAGYFEAVRDRQKRRHGWEPDVSRMSFSLGVVRLYTPQGGNFDRFWTNMDIHRHNAFSAVATQSSAATLPQRLRRCDCLHDRHPAGEGQGLAQQKAGPGKAK